MMLEAGSNTLANVSCTLINRKTGNQVLDIQTWDTREQEGTLYNTDIYTEFKITKDQYSHLEREYGDGNSEKGKILLKKDIADNKVKIVFSGGK